MKIHTKFSSMQNLKTKKKKHYFISCGESKSVALLCIKGSKGATNSVTYIFTVASSYVTIHFLAFTYVNIFFPLHLCNCKDNRQISVPFDTIIFSLYVTNTPLYFELKCALKHTIVSLLRVGQMQTQT